MLLCVLDCVFLLLLTPSASLSSRLIGSVSQSISYLFLGSGGPSLRAEDLLTALSVSAFSSFQPIISTAKEAS